MLSVITLIICLAAAIAEQGESVSGIRGVTVYTLTGVLLIGIAAPQLTLASKNSKLSRFWTSNRKQKRALFAFLLFLLYTLITCIYSHNPARAFSHYLVGISYASVGFIFFIILMQQRRSSGFVFMTAGALALLYFFYTVSSLAALDLNNKITRFNDRNVFVEHFFYGLLIFTYGLSQFKLKGKHIPNRTIYIVYYLLATTIILLAIFTGSRRGPFAYGSFILLAPLIVQSIFGVSKIKSLFAVVCLTIIAGFSISIFGGLIDISSGLDRALQTTTTFILGDLLGATETAHRINSQGLALRSFSVLTGDSDISARRETWAEAMEIIGQFNVTELLIGGGSGAWLVEMVGGRTPHNFILASFMEGGLLQVLIVLYLYFSILKIVLLAVKYGSFFEAVSILASFLIWSMAITVSGSGLFAHKAAFLLFFLYIYCFTYNSLNIRRKIKKNQFNVIPPKNNWPNK